MESAETHYFIVRNMHVKAGVVAEQSFKQTADRIVTGEQTDNTAEIHML